MQHCASYLSGNYLEGINRTYALSVFIQIVNATNKAFARDDAWIDETTKQLSLQALDDLAYFTMLFEICETKAQTDKRPIQPEPLIEAIQKKCDERGYCYLPSGWSNPLVPGHYASAKISKNADGSYSFSYLNRGGGLQYHEKLSVYDEKVKYDYQSRVYHFDRASDSFKLFLNAFLSLLSLSHTPENCSEQELYGILALHGRLQQSEPDIKRQTTPQRSGTCAFTNTALVIKDTLLFNAKLSPVATKRYEFFIKLSSIVTAYKYLQESAKVQINEEELELLDLAVKELYVRLQKLHPDGLKDTELHEIRAYADAISASIAGYKKEILEAICVKKDFPGLISPYSLLSKPLIIQTKGTQDIKEKEPIQTLNLGSFSASDAVLARLNEAYTYFTKAGDTLQTRWEFKKFMRALPKPSGAETDVFWDKTPIEDVPAILHSLVQLNEFAKINTFNQNERLELGMISYDICAQIAPRIPALKLGSDFCLGMDDTFSSDLEFFEPSAFLAVSECAKRFIKRSALKQTLFNNTLSDESSMKAYLLGLLDLPTRQAIKQALNKVLKKKNRHLMNNDISDNDCLILYLTQKFDYETLDINNLLPKELIDVRKLACFAQQITKDDLIYVQEDDVYFVTGKAEKLHREFAKLYSELLWLNNPETHKKLMVAHKTLKELIPYQLFPSNNKIYRDLAENTIYQPDELRFVINKSTSMTLPWNNFFDGSLKNYDRWEMYWFSRQHFNAAIDESLKRIQVDKGFSVLRFLSWIEQYIKEVFDAKGSYDSNPLLLVFQQIFSYGVFYYALANTPEETNYRIKKALNYSYAYSHFEFKKGDVPNIKGYLHLCSLETLYRVWAQALNKAFLLDKDFPSCQTQLRSLFCSVPKLSQPLVALIILANLKTLAPFTKEDLQYALASQLILSQVKGAQEKDLLANCCAYEAVEAWHVLRESIKETLRSQSAEERDAFIYQVLSCMGQDYLVNKDTQWVLEEACLKSSTGSAVLDLDLGALVVDKTALTNVNQQLYNNLLNQLAFRAMGIDIQQVQFSLIYEANPIAGCDVQALTEDGEIFYCNVGFNPAASQSNSRNSILAIKKRIEVDNVSSIWDLSFLNRSSLLNQQGFASFLSRHNADSPYTNSGFLSWIDSQDDRVIIEHPSKPNRAMLCDSKGDWHKLSGKRGKWVSTGVVFLNSRNSTISFVNEWKSYLKRVCEPQKILFKALFNKQNATLELRTISLPALGLHFYINQGKPYCKEHNGFYLSALQASTALNGLDSVLILEKDEGGAKEYKYLLPISRLKKQGTAFYGRNPLSMEEQKGCVLLERNKKGELYAKTPEGNFRLSIVYALQGDFQKAMKSLDYSYSHKANTTEIENLLLEYNQCKPNTPEAYAFFCQLHKRYLEHNAKWTKVRESTKESIDALIKKAGIENKNAYLNSISTQRHEVDIIPAYLRLPLDYFNNINTPSPNNFGCDFYDEKISNSNSHELSWDFISCADNYGSWLDTHIKQKELPFYPPVKIIAEQRHKIGKDIDGEESTLNDDTMAFVNAHLVNLFELALDEKPINIERFNSYMFHISHSETNYEYTIKEYIAVLRYVHNNKARFKNIIPVDTSQNLIKKLALIFTTIQTLKNPEIFSASRNKTNAVKGSKKSHWLEKKNPPVFSLLKLGFPKTINHPLKKELEQFFSITRKPLLDPLKVPDFRMLSNPNPIEREILAKLKEGFKKNSKVLRKQFSFKKDSFSALKKELPILISKQEQVVDALQKRILLFANALPNDSSLENTRSMIMADRQTGKRPPIDIKSLMAALLNQDLTNIHYSNPLLSQKALDKLLQWACDYIIEHSKLVQMNEAMSLVTEYAEVLPLPSWVEQLIGEIFDKERTYSPKEYPEILVYEYATNTMLREGQAEKIIELIQIIENSKSNNEYRHALLQFRAGGGKTAVLIPLLTQRIIRKGLVPVIFNTNELYQIAEQEIPDSLKNSLQINIEVIERELDFEWSIEDCHQLLRDLNRWKTQKKSILLKAASWHSLHLTYKSAMDVANYALARVCASVLAFFKNECVKLEDEGQLISDPLQEYIRTDTPSQTFGATQTDIMLEFYHCLMGQVESCKELADLSGIKNKSRKVVAPHELMRIQELLIEHIISHKEFASLNKSALKKYLLSKEKNRPNWLLDIEKKQTDLANSVIFVAAFIKTHLPHLLRLQYKKDYGPSIHKGDLTAAPKHDGIDVRSHFADPLLLLALTTQMTQQEGIPEECIKEIFDLLKQAHNKQVHSSSICTEAEIQIIKLLPEAFCLSDIERLDPAMIAKDESVRYFPPLMDYYLRTYVFVQIKMPTKLYSSTPADMQAGFRYSLSFTATTGFLEAYPIQLTKDNCLFAGDFEAEVVSTLLNDSNNQGIIIKEMHSPEDLFAEIKKNYPLQFQRMTALIDSGALLSSYDSSKISNALKAILGPDIKEANTLFFSGESMRLEGAGVKPVTLKGTRIWDALKEQNIQLEDVLIFLFLDLAHTTGTDVKRPYKDRAGLTVGKGLGLDKTIQAAMRERQLLREDAQSIVWILFQNLYEQINPNAKTFDLKQVLLWMVRNQSLDDEHKILMRAYQGLNQLMHAYATALCRSGKLKREVLLKNFSKKITLSIKDMYELSSTMEDTKQVLNAYVLQLCQNYQVSQKEFPDTLNQQITRIIDETHRLIPKTLSTKASELSAENVHEREETVQQQQQQTLKTSQDSSSSIMFQLETYDENETLDSIFNGKHDGYTDFILPGCEDIAMPALLCNPSHMRPFFHNDIQRIKPLDTVVVQRMPDGRYRFLACSLAGGKLFREQLIRKELDTNSPAYMMVDGSGELLFKSNNTTAAMAADCRASDAFNDAMSYIELINGRIIHSERMSQFLKKWNITEDLYNRLVASVKKIHISRTPVDLEFIPYLRSLCGWSPLDAIIKKRLGNKFREPVETRGSYQSNTQSGATPIALHTINVLSPVLTPVIVGLPNETPALIYQSTKLTADELRAAINDAVDKYRAYHQDPEKFKHFARGKRGFFTSLRHRGYEGRIKTLLTGLYNANLEKIAQHLDDFMNSSNTQFNRHSLSSYVLDSISKTMKEKEQDSPGLTLEADGKYQRIKVWNQLKINQQWKTNTQPKSNFLGWSFR